VSESKNGKVVQIVPPTTPPQTDTATDDGADDNEVKTQIGLQVPPDMRTELVYAAKREGITLSAWCRQVLAEAVGFDLSTVPMHERAGKYESDAERQAAIKLSQKRANAKAAAKRAADAAAATEHAQFMAALKALGIDGMEGLAALAAKFNAK
jgi:hypothetical protein